MLLSKNYTFFDIVPLEIQISCSFFGLTGLNLLASLASSGIKREIHVIGTAKMTGFVLFALQTLT